MSQKKREPLESFEEIFQNIPIEEREIWYYPPETTEAELSILNDSHADYEEIEKLWEKARVYTEKLNGEKIQASKN